ncbi:MAG: AEC family transporter [Desulfofustis sp.]|nr:AEC family transporter [Desulfofustis sp.]
MPACRHERIDAVVTIIPIFAVILLGWAARRRGVITGAFLEPANRLVYSFSIPALIFGAIAKTSFHQKFDVRVVSFTILAIVLIYLISYAITRLSGMADARAGAFILSSAHSNVGYLGLPIAYYYLGAEGFAAAGIICGFVMIVQNVLSVIFLQLHQPSREHCSSGRSVLRALAGNPVIGGALAGMLVSIMSIDLPLVVWRTIDMLGGLAPPMALLLIGASLSVGVVRTSLAATFGSLLIKLALLPAVALLLFQLAQLRPAEFLPAIILLCAPPATIVYVMVRGMNCDADFADTQISLGTILSAVTISVWLSVISRLPVTG